MTLSRMGQALTRLRVEDLPKHQALGRGGHARQPTIPRRQQVGDRLGRKPAESDLHQGPHDSPAHLVQESIGADHDGQLWTGPKDGASRDGPDRVVPRISR